jgi:hypothetical protein
MIKPKLAIVSSHKVCCGIAYYAEALKGLLSPSFESAASANVYEHL